MLSASSPLSPQRQTAYAVLHSHDRPATNNKWIVLSIAAIGVFMATLDSSIVGIGLPTIANYFAVPLSGAIEWVVIAYLVTIAATLLTIGRLADLVGHKLIQRIGLIVFTASSALCGCSLSLGMLIIARAVQGLGAACFMAVGPALLTRAFPQSERGRAMGLNTLFVALGTTVGPTLGGLITAYVSWRWIFLVNVPLGLVGLLISLGFLRERIPRDRQHFDPLGMVLLALGLASLTATLSFGQELGWTSLPILAGILVGALALLILPLVEQRVPHPILVPLLLRNRIFTSSVLSQVLSYLALFAVGFLMPFYLEELRGFSAREAGLLLSALPLTIAAIAPLSGALADRIGTRWLTAGGLMLSCVGLISISRLDAHSSILDIVWRLMITGAGQAIFQSPNNSALMGAAPRNLQGSASGFLATGRVVGQSMSVALTGAIFTGLGGAAAGRALLSNTGDAVERLQHTFVTGFQAAFVACAALAALGVLCSLIRGNEREHANRQVNAQGAGVYTPGATNLAAKVSFAGLSNMQYVSGSAASFPTAQQRATSGRDLLLTVPPVLLPPAFASGRRTRHLGIEEQTTQLHAMFKQASSTVTPVHYRMRPLIALLLTRGVEGVDRVLFEYLSRDAIVLCTSAPPDTTCHEEAFKLYFDREIWPLLLSLCKLRIQGLCLLVEAGRQSLPLRSVSRLTGLLLWLIGLPVWSTGAEVSTGHLPPDLSTFLSTCAMTAPPPLEEIIKRREELYAWLSVEYMATSFTRSTSPLSKKTTGLITPNARLRRKQDLMRRRHPVQLTPRRAI